MNSIENIKSELFKVRLAAESLSLYRNIKTDIVVIKLCVLIDSLTQADPSFLKSISAYNDLCFEIFNKEKNYSLKNHVIEKIIFDENQFTKNAEVTHFKDIHPTMKNAAESDLFMLQCIAEFSPLLVKEYLIRFFSISDFERIIIEKLPTWVMESCIFTHNKQYSSHTSSIINCISASKNWSLCIEELASFHNKYGSGIFSKYKAFVWEHQNGIGGIKGIENPDPIALQDLIGYDVERSNVINNTLQFLKGFPSNNVLLYGDRGTGKSSTVKALLNEYYTLGLRLIEIPKKHLMEFTEVIRILSNRKLKFIIFIDDLAFEDSEETYTGLKAILEGGIENRPENVLIYATSNRRHLIKEKFSDRSGLQSTNTEDEIRASDTLQEKLSLSDRFGITVVFSSPDKYKFLEIVDGIVHKRGLKVDKEYLHKEALKWELWYNGRSPRTARQFVDWLEGELVIKK